MKHIGFLTEKNMKKASLEVGEYFTYVKVNSDGNRLLKKGMIVTPDIMIPVDLTIRSLKGYEDPYYPEGIDTENCVCGNSEVIFDRNKRDI